MQYDDGGDGIPHYHPSYKSSLRPNPRSGIFTDLSWRASESMINQWLIEIVSGVKFKFTDFISLFCANILIFPWLRSILSEFPTIFLRETLHLIYQIALQISHSSFSKDGHQLWANINLSLQFGVNIWKVRKKKIVYQKTNLKSMCSENPNKSSFDELSFDELFWKSS